MRLIAGFVTLFLMTTGLAACKGGDPEPAKRKSGFVGEVGWEHLPESAAWQEAALAALDDEGAVLISTVPDDIGAFCPGYQNAASEERKAFWLGLFSKLAREESDWNAKAKGGGGRWLGLMQIAPETAEANGCGLGEGGLLDGGMNLACAVRIAANQVGRDGAIASSGGGTSGWLGLARDWVPLRNGGKRDEIAAWTREQSYCR